MKGNVRIGGALLFGIAIVVIAFLVRPNNGADTGSVAVVSAPERHYIQTSDSDGDGTQDWEEELEKQIFETLPDPIPLTIDEGVQYEEPSTFTDQFARSFFEDFVEVKTRGAPLQSQEEFLSGAITSVEKDTRDELFTRNDIIIIDATDQAAVREYGNAIAYILNSRSIDNVNEATILSRALETNDPEMLKDLAPIREVYEHYIQDTLLTPVPRTLAKQHLDLLNTYQAILTDIIAMEQAFSDPLYTLVRMKRYEGDAAGMFFALNNIYTALTNEGIVYAQDEPGALFYFFESTV